MIKVYFGPYRYSPAPPLGNGEATLWFPDFGLLRGYDRDFWTNNPMHLDLFDPAQIYLWQDQWVALSTARDDLITEAHVRKAIRELPPGRQAMACEILWYQRQREQANNPPQAS